MEVDVESVFGADGIYDVDFSDVKGQEPPPSRWRGTTACQGSRPERAMEEAVSGDHNILTVIGPPEPLGRHAAVVRLIASPNIGDSPMAE